MIWQEEMNRSAVKLAFPDWELRDDDNIIVKTGWEDGYFYSEDTFETARYFISVSVYRAGTWRGEHATFDNKNAGEFFTKLMRRASYEDVSKLDTMHRIAKREALQDTEVRAKRKQLGLQTAKDVYDTAMRWVNINDAIREKVHHLAQKYDGRPNNAFDVSRGEIR